jgi:hypothetical protein
MPRVTGLALLIATIAVPPGALTAIALSRQERDAGRAVHGHGLPPVVVG